MNIHFLKRFFSKAQHPKQAVLVLGSGRSGTSVLTKCINFMGISLGTDNLLAPSKKINPKGYFENKDIINIHKAIGSKIRYRPAFEGYYDSSKIKKDRANLTKYLTDKFHEAQYLVIKDPRMNDYIELWQHVLDDIHVKPAEIILIRNPLDVVASNSRAWHRDKTMALRQWQVRTLLSLRDTKGQPRLVVSYEDLFHKTLPTLKRVATQLDLPWPQDENELQKKIDGFIDPKLQKSDSGESLEAFKAEKNLTDDVKNLYLLAVKASNDDHFLASKEFDDQIKHLTTRYVEKYGSLYRDFNTNIPGKTVYVYGTDTQQVNSVNELLAEKGIPMDNENTKRIHDLLSQVSQQLENNPQETDTYADDFAYLEEKEDINNYVRKSAKKKVVWGIGDVLTGKAIEMLMTVSEEMNLNTRNILIVDDEKMARDTRQKSQLLETYERILKRLNKHPHLVIYASELTNPGIKQQVSEFVESSQEVAQSLDYQQRVTHEVVQLKKLGSAL